MGRKANWLSMLDFRSNPWHASGHDGNKTISSLRIKRTQIKAGPRYGEGKAKKGLSKQEMGVQRKNFFLYTLNPATHTQLA